MIKIKVLYLCNIKDNSRGGLFLAVVNRLKYINKNNDVFYKAISIITEDTKPLRFFKKKLNRQINFSIKDSFNYDKVKISYLKIKRNIIKSIIYKIYYKLDLIEYKKNILKEIKINDYDIIHAHWAYPIGYVAYLIKKQYSIPYVLTVHGSDIHTNPFINKKVCRYTLNALENAEVVEFVSSGLLKTAKEFGYSGNNAVIIKNSVDLDLFKRINKKAAKEKLGLQGKVVGFVGNLVYIKRADKLPEIIEYVEETIKNCTFIIVGDGELRYELENVCKQKGLRVKFYGSIKQEELGLFYNAMDILILPSRNEGLGNVILEAYACNTNVIASKVGGIPEIINNVNLLVEDNELFESNFSNKIVEVLKTNKNQEINCSVPTWEDVSNEEYKLYKKIVNKF